MHLCDFISVNSVVNDGKWTKFCAHQRYPRETLGNWFPADLRKLPQNFYGKDSVPLCDFISVNSLVNDGKWTKFCAHQQYPRETLGNWFPADLRRLPQNFYGKDSVPLCDFISVNSVVNDGKWAKFCAHQQYPRETLGNWLPADLRKLPQNFYGKDSVHLCDFISVNSVVNDGKWTKFCAHQRYPRETLGNWFPADLRKLPQNFYGKFCAPL